MPPPRRSIAVLLPVLPLVLALVGSLGGCGALVVADTPLRAHAEQRGVAAGTPVTGTVENPDGEITVTLARDSRPAPAPGRHTRGARACDYDTDEATYSCPTDGLRPGLHRVEVTDAALASEGTRLVTVAVTEQPGYAPEVVVRGGGTRDPASVDGPLGFSDDRGVASLELSGWEPGRTVTVALVATESAEVVRRRTVVPDDAGEARLRVGPLPDGTYVLQGRDGLWADARAEGWTSSTLLVEARSHREAARTLVPGQSARRTR